jgi:hypothetical protein
MSLQLNGQLEYASSRAVREGALLNCRHQNTVEPLSQLPDLISSHLSRTAITDAQTHLLQ